MWPLHCANMSVCKVHCRGRGRGRGGASGLVFFLFLGKSSRVGCHIVTFLTYAWPWSNWPAKSLYLNAFHTGISAGLRSLYLRAEPGLGPSRGWTLDLCGPTQMTLHQTVVFNLPTAVTL